MLTIRFARPRQIRGALAIPVARAAALPGRAAAHLAPAVHSGRALDDEVSAFVSGTGHSGAAGALTELVRPGGRPHRVLLVGVGSGDEAGWRAAGAALARAARGEATLTVGLPPAPRPAGKSGGGQPDHDRPPAGDRAGTGDTAPRISSPGVADDRATEEAPPDGDPAVDADAAVVRGLTEGLLLAAYRFRPASHRRPGAPGRPARDEGPALRQVVLLADDTAPRAAALATGRTVALATCLARDLTNTPGQDKSPAWFAAQVVREAGARTGLRVRVRDPAQLAAEGFGGILAVGGGSARGPRLVELAWRPPGARRHVVLVGKGITFDTGGICIKPRDGMKLMRKDMGGAAAVIAATLGAADLRLPVRITTVVPMAENMPSGSAYRPGDVVRHYGGRTSEILNTDAEGRIVLGDALAYAVRRLRPDLIIDLATLTGANAVALGKRTAALYSDDDQLAQQLAEAARAAGEQVWRMPMPDDYLEQITSHVADMANAATSGSGAGSIVAALFLREFTGTARHRWAHLDMSAPAWADSPDGELVKGATGWGVRTLLRLLPALGDEPRDESRDGPGDESRDGPRHDDNHAGSMAARYDILTTVSA